MFGPHLIDYTKLASYKKLIKLAPESTGKIQAKNGTIRFDHNGYGYHIYSYGKVSKNRGAGTQKLINITDIASRTSKDYDKAFNEIIFKVEGKRHKAKNITKWDQQLYQAKQKVFSILFEDIDARHKHLVEILSDPESQSPWMFGGQEKKDRFMKMDDAKRLHFILKDRNIIQKGVDYK